jgi:NADPH2:quinone reductase
VRAAVVAAPGQRPVEILDVVEPTAGPGRVVVDVHAAGVSFPDVLYAQGRYQLRPEPPFVLGQECAGIVLEAPSGSAFAPGDRVAAYCSDLGAFAEAVSVPIDMVLPLPDTVGFDEGACLVINYLTAHFALFRRAGLRPGQTVLVHGAAGGVGTAAVQLARAAGATVVAVTSDDAKAALARDVGAHHAVAAPAFLKEVRALVPDGVDVVVDPVGGDRFTDSLRCLAMYGKLLVIGFTAGDIPTVKVNRLLLTNTDVVGVGWGGVAVQPGVLTQQWSELLPWIGSGQCRPVVTEVLALDDVAHALSLLADRRVLGRAVLRIR